MSRIPSYRGEFFAGFWICLSLVFQIPPEKAGILGRVFGVQLLPHKALVIYIYIYLSYTCFFVPTFTEMVHTVLMFSHRENPGEPAV